jgi:hypothetical protein
MLKNYGFSTNRFLAAHISHFHLLLVMHNEFNIAANRRDSANFIASQTQRGFHLLKDGSFTSIAKRPQLIKLIIN